MSIVIKPWGQELIWAHTEKYVGKILTIKKGHRLSRQFHNVKDETVMVLSGELILSIFTGCVADDKDPVQGLVIKDHRMSPGESLHIPPKTVHRMTAVTDCEVLEVSTPELDDVVRVEDDYGR